MGATITTKDLTMTHTQQRSRSEPVRSDSPGGAPRGMWAVAWRLHRVQVFSLLGVAAVTAAALLLFRSRVVEAWTRYGCDPFGTAFRGDCADETGTSVWWNYGFSGWSAFLHLVMKALPVAFGAFAAAPVFTHEFSQRTHIFALTESVGPRRWFTVKITVVAVPLTAALLALGFLMQWTDGVVDVTGYQALDSTHFFTWGIIPAAIGLMVFGLTIAVGMITRAVLTTLVTGLMLGTVILVAVDYLQPRVLSPVRTATAFADVYAPVTQAELDAQASAPPQDPPPVDVDERAIDFGYLDAAGNPLPHSADLALNSCWAEASRAGEQAAVAAGLADASEVAAAGSEGSGGDGPAYAVPLDEEVYNSAVYINASNAAMLDCASARGTAAFYQDVLPGSMLWPLRLLIGGILLALAALFTALGAWWLRRAIPTAR